VTLRDDDKLAEMAKALDLAGDYRVLRRLVPRAVGPSVGEETKTCVIVDVETTGLDAGRNEVI
jgi:DNA polymerase-3 subunit epsilon